MEQTMGKRIMENRKRLGLTQDQLAERLGVTAQAVSKWENDQSCPDIAMLPQLADIFGISTDALLGREKAEPKVTVVTGPETEEEEQKGHWQFTWNSGKRHGVAFGLFVLLTGAIYLLSELLHWGHDLWDVAWPTAVFMFGLSGLFPKLSFFHLACTLFGGWNVAELFVDMPFGWDSGIIWAVLVLLFGISLLADALRKPKKPKFHVTYTDRSGKAHRGQTVNDYECDDDSFRYNASFGESIQRVDSQCLADGEVKVSFGDYTVDLSGVERVEEDCRIEARCSFGELNLLVPRRYTVKAVSSTSMAAFNIGGHPDPEPEGIIRLDAHVSFGEINVKYI